MSAPAVQLHCPRCGYDLSGQAAAWTDHCPLTGTCSECGLELAWVTIYHPRRLAPRWSIEHAPRLTPWTIINTLARTLVPWRFWRAFGLELPVRLGRFVWVVLGVWAAAVPLALVGNGSVEFGARAWTPPYTVSLIRWHKDASLLDTVESDLVHGHIMRPTIGTVAAFLAWSVTTPAAFLTLYHSIGESRIRIQHLLRIAAYTLAAWSCFAALALIGAFALTPYHYTTSPSFFRLLSLIRDRIHLVEPLIPAMWVAWFVSFWYFAVATYLRLPKPGVTLGLMLTLSALSAAILLAAAQLLFQTSIAAF